MRVNGRDLNDISEYISSSFGDKKGIDIEYIGEDVIQSKDSPLCKTYDAIEYFSDIEDPTELLYCKCGNHLVQADIGDVMVTP